MATGTLTGHTRIAVCQKQLPKRRPSVPAGRKSYRLFTGAWAFLSHMDIGESCTVFTTGHTYAI